jgi:hypothetical protein
VKRKIPNPCRESKPDRPARSLTGIAGKVTYRMSKNILSISMQRKERHRPYIGAIGRPDFIILQIKQNLQMKT